MYIHRIVIDANVINMRRAIHSVNELEDFHEAGLVEIFRTSTMDVDLTPDWRQQKARSYARLGGQQQVYMTGQSIAWARADAQIGTGVLRPRFMEIGRTIFAEFPPSRFQDERDVLHIDQANQHLADFFVTDDKELLAAAEKLSSLGLVTRISHPDVCLQQTKDHFVSSYGTTELAVLSMKLSEDGPIILGSNSCGKISFRDPDTSEELLGFEPVDGGVGIRAVLKEPKPVANASRRHRSL